MDSGKACLVDATVKGKRKTIPLHPYVKEAVDVAVCIGSYCLALFLVVMLVLGYVLMAASLHQQTHASLNITSAASLANTTASLPDAGTRAEGEQGLALQVVHVPQEGGPALHRRKKRSSLARSMKNGYNKEDAVQGEMRARALFCICK